MQQAATEAFRASPYQQAIFDFVRSGTGHGVVQATAGSGKTTTLVEVAKRLPNDLKVCFLAYNKHTADELRARLPAHVEAKTVHALGMRTLAWHLRTRGQLEVNNSKYRTLVREELREVREAWAVSGDTLQACDTYLFELSKFARYNLTNSKNERAVRAVAMQYNLAPPEDPELEDDMHARLKTVLRRGVDLAMTVGLIDYTDMVYVPLVKRLRPFQFDFVCVDEAQDLSVMALEFCMRLTLEEGRQLFVGDPRQSIYGFAGADTDAIDRIVRRTAATVLPLSVTYRCPRSHVALAVELAPEIESAPQAVEGKVYLIKDHMLGAWARDGDLVICRMNGPLIGTCLDLVRDGKRAFVMGKDLARQLMGFAKRAFKGGWDGWEERLEAFVILEENRLWEQVQDEQHARTLVARTYDFKDCLVYLLRDLARDAAVTEVGLQALLERTFNDKERAITLSTVHKAKGREANRVFILYPNLMPASYARTPEALRGEVCVEFVALTRAKRELVFVEAPKRDSITKLAGAPMQGTPMGG